MRFRKTNEGETVVYKCYACGREIERPGELCPYCRFPVISTLHGDQVEEQQILEFVKEYREANPQFFPDEHAADDKAADDVRKKAAQSVANAAVKLASEQAQTKPVKEQKPVKNTTAAAPAPSAVKTDEAAEWRKKYEDLRKEYQRVNAANAAGTAKAADTVKTAKTVSSVQAADAAAPAVPKAAAEVNVCRVIAVICFGVLLIQRFTNSLDVYKQLSEYGMTITGIISILRYSIYTIAPAALYLVAAISGKSRILKLACFATVIINVITIIRQYTAGSGGYPTMYINQQIIFTIGQVLFLLFALRDKFTAGGILAGIFSLYAYIYILRETNAGFPGILSLLTGGLCGTLCYICIGIAFKKLSAAKKNKQE